MKTFAKILVYIVLIYLPLIIIMYAAIDGCNQYTIFIVAPITVYITAVFESTMRKYIEDKLD